jgi:hypothetical protein
MYLSREAKILEQPFIIKLGMLSSPQDLEGLRCFVALKMSDSDVKSAKGHYSVIHSDIYSKERFDRPTESALRMLRLLHEIRRSKHH